ncbi:MAG: hypothetical protein NWE76_02510 [Candidatus Bathyarchaeota archaeon]|nr:hypothetical protein [Candidatus Bathyarchaeota archaeon]
MEFPKRVYTDDEVRSARVLIDKGYQHRLRIVGSQAFRQKVQEALKIIKTAGRYNFLRTYIRTIREIDGLSQLREGEAAVWANMYAIGDPIGAACLFVQKAWQMKRYIEGKVYYGHVGEAEAVDARLRFLEELGRKTKDPKVSEECRRRIQAWDESKFL